MAIKNLQEVTCSLNLGYIYNVNYTFDPKTGVKIIVFFITENGQYPGIPTNYSNGASSNVLNALSPSVITIGPASFAVYPISYEVQNSNDKKVLKVEFRDANFKLDNYFIVLGGRGCGPNGVVFSLGQPFQYLNSTSTEEQNRWILQQYISFVDLEYGFQDFINVLQRIFPVALGATFDQTIQRNFSGSFREVLDAWCSYLNLSYFFENNQIYIYNPQTLAGIAFPTVPSDALSSTFGESLDGTDRKSVV